MKAIVEKIIEKYLDFSGERSAKNFTDFINEVHKATEGCTAKEREALDYIHKKLMKGLSVCVQYGTDIYVIVEDTYEQITGEEEDLGTSKSRPRTRRKKTPVKKSPSKTARKKGRRKSKKASGKDLGRRKESEDLGKLVDDGEVPTSGRADRYWDNKGMKVIFTANNRQIRTGSTIPTTYHYADMNFVEKYYNLRAFEFGNWLSQQDRVNYVAGLGLALYDLSDVLGFNAKQIGLGRKISVAFGARGRGASLAHFEPETFAINITRYSRPRKGSSKRKGFDRTDLLVASGGVGSFAHEYGHALDYLGGTYFDRHASHALSHGTSLRVMPNRKLMGEKSLQGAMERLLFKIIWNGNKHSAYYERLKKGKYGKYYYRRNELFARAFEAYVQYKLDKRKHKNIFLAETKYSPRFYLTGLEIKKMEKEFDELISLLKRRI